MTTEKLYNTQKRPRKSYTMTTEKLYNAILSPYCSKAEKFHNS